MSGKNRASKYGTTEDLPDANLHIDKMDTSDALIAMLESQAESFSAVKVALPFIEVAAYAAYKKLSEQSTGRLIYAGAGTSARIGVQDGAELPPTFNWPKNRIDFLIAGGASALISAIENAEDNTEAGVAAVKAKNVGVDDVVIGLAASGQTPYTVGVVNAAQDAGATTIGIANNPNTALLQAVSYPIFIATGGEIIAGSTRLKAGTSQKICLNLISNIIMTKMGFVTNGMMSSMVPTNEKLRRRREQIEAAFRK